MAWAIACTAMAVAAVAVAFMARRAFKDFILFESEKRSISAAAKSGKELKKIREELSDLQSQVAGLQMRIGRGRQ